MFYRFTYRFLSKLHRAHESFMCKCLKRQLGYISPSASFAYPDRCLCPSKIYLYDKAHTSGHDKFIISSVGEEGKFIMKKNSGAAEGLTVITGSHPRIKGQSFKDENGMCYPEQIINKDIVVEEEVMIGANVTITSGVTIGRSANIGGGSVVRHSVPPYSIVIGNPAKVIGFIFTPEEIIEHELLLYPESERIPKDILDNNYNKYFLRRLKDIQAYNKL